MVTGLTTPTQGRPIVSNRYSSIQWSQALLHPHRDVRLFQTGIAAFNAYSVDPDENCCTAHLVPKSGLDGSVRDGQACVSDM
jgi:hypothetical protein